MVSARQALTRRGRIVLILGLGQAVGRGSVAAYTVVVIRRMTPGAYGDVAFGLALTAVVAVAADGGLSRLIIRDVARTGTGAESPATQLLAVRLVWISVVAVVAFATGLLGAVSFGFLTLLLLLIYMVGEASALGFESLAVATEQPWRIAIGQLVQAFALAAAAVLLLASTRATQAGAVAGLAAASALKISWHALSWRGRLPVTPAGSRLPLRRWARDAAPFLALTLLAVLYYRVGVIALHMERGGAATAPYAAAFRVVEGVAAGAGVVFSALAPPLSRAHRDRPEEIWHLWIRLVRVAALSAALLGAAIAVTAHPLASALFGSQYGKVAGDDLQLLCPGMFFLVLQTITASVVFMSDEHSHVITLTVANVGFCVVVTAALVALSGSSGAAIGTSVSEGVSFLGFAWLLRHRHMVSVALGGSASGRI